MTQTGKYMGYTDPYMGNTDDILISKPFEQYVSDPNAYIDITKTFTWDGLRRAEITSYIHRTHYPFRYYNTVSVKCNGTWIYGHPRRTQTTFMGPITDDHSCRYNRLELTPFLIPGSNTITVRLYAAGDNYIRLCARTVIHWFETRKINTTDMLFSPHYFNLVPEPSQPITDHLYFPFGNYGDPLYQGDMGYRIMEQSAQYYDNPVLVYYDGVHDVWISGSSTETRYLWTDDGFEASSLNGRILKYSLVEYPNPLIIDAFKLTPILNVGYTMVWFNLYSGPYTPWGCTANANMPEPVYLFYETG